MDNGGSAFPVAHQEDQGGAVRAWSETGMTLRDYFAAHAPAEPQQWFSPVLTEPAPQRPDLPAEIVGTRRSYLIEYGDVMRLENAQTPVERQYLEAVKAYEKARTAHNIETGKQFYVQWPGAWADEQIKARKS
jgi:hypothetical protein